MSGYELRLQFGRVSAVSAVRPKVTLADAEINKIWDGAVLRSNLDHDSTRLDAAGPQSGRVGSEH